jgi:hypothetical protein
VMACEAVSLIADVAQVCRRDSQPRTSVVHTLLTKALTVVKSSLTDFRHLR